MKRAGILLFLTVFSCIGASPTGAQDTASIAVGNCNDSGPGSLRQAAATAPDGARLDLSRLTCGRILLTRGQIEILQQNLTLIGPGVSRLTVDGNGRYRVLRHRGAGTLRIERLALANGSNRTPTAYGGCVRSQGTVELKHAAVHHCNVVGVPEPDVETPFARGGGIHADRNVSLWYSRAYSNTAQSDIGALGGGISAGRNVLLVHSTIEGNASLGINGSGGGAFSNGNVVIHRTRLTRNRATSAGALGSSGDVRTNYALIDHNTAVLDPGLSTSQHADIVKTTISDNVAARGAALRVRGDNRMNTITQSTISGNVGGPVSAAEFDLDVTIFNSTIAFNRGSTTTLCLAAISAFSPYLESVIAARNDCANDIAWSYEPNATNSLVGRPAGLNQSFSADPRLGTLGYYGGLVPVHPLLFDSPAIDRGTNYLDLPYDERGPGFPRTKGLQTDIGAFER